MTDESVRRTDEQRGSSGWVMPVAVFAAALAVVGWRLAGRASVTPMIAEQSLSADLQTIKQGYAKDMDAVQQRLTQAEKTNSGLQERSRRRDQAVADHSGPTQESTGRSPE